MAIGAASAQHPPEMIQDYFCLLFRAVAVHSFIRNFPVENFSGEIATHFGTKATGEKLSKSFL